MVRALLLFTKESVKSGAAKPADLKKLLEATTQDLSVDVATYEELVFTLSNDGSTVAIAGQDAMVSDYDVVYLRRIHECSSVAMAIGKHCLSHNVPVIDLETANRPGSMTKLTQYVQFADAGISIPKTIYSPSHELLLAELAKGALTFPLILKSTSGSRGEDNYLVKSFEDAEKLCAEHSKTPFLAQQFIANTADYRVWVCGDRIGPILHRSRQEGHKNNTSQGGAADMTDKSVLPAAVLDECVRAAGLLQRNVAGADVIFENDDLQGRYYFLEVNRSPQIEGTPFEDIKARALGEYLKARGRGTRA